MYLEMAVALSKEGKYTYVYYIYLHQSFGSIPMCNLSFFKMAEMKTCRNNIKSFAFLSLWNPSWRWRLLCRKVYDRRRSLSFSCTIYPFQQRRNLERETETEKSDRPKVSLFLSVLWRSMQQVRPTETGRHPADRQTEEQKESEAEEEKKIYLFIQPHSLTTPWLLHIYICLWLWPVASFSPFLSFPSFFLFFPLLT